MQDNSLHIISFDIPIPVNYGGVIDVYHKLEGLKKSGVKIYLHCFEYNREHADKLNDICEKVYYYPRKMSFLKLFSRNPYIVASRQSDLLLQNLLENDFPILFEGLHTCLLLNNNKLKDRRKIVRTHNIEHDYYKNLGKSEKNRLKKIYFYQEAKKLKRFEAILNNADAIASISYKDKSYFQKYSKNTTLVSAFHPHTKVESKVESGEYALYHGSLKVPENNKAALFLVEQVFADLSHKLIIAGNKASQELKQKVEKYPNISIKEDLDSEEIYRLIKEAHINVLPTFQATGIKLKLLAALYQGRFCLVNTPMIENTGLKELCIVADSAKEMQKNIEELFEKDFDQENIKKREKLLNNGVFSNQNNIKILYNLLFISRDK